MVRSLHALRARAQALNIGPGREFTGADREDQRNKLTVSSSPLEQSISSTTCGTTLSAGSLDSLRSLLQRVGCHPSGTSEERRRDRIAGQVANLVEDICTDVSRSRDLVSNPLTVNDVLKFAPRAKDLITAVNAAKENEILATNAVALGKMRGRAFTTEVVGVLSRNLDVQRAMELFNVSETTVRDSVREMYTRLDATAEQKGPFETMNMRPGVKREKISREERDITREWFLAMNPARSGDVKPTAWMTQSPADFYFTEYRGRYHEIMVRTNMYMHSGACARISECVSARNTINVLCVCGGDRTFVCSCMFSRSFWLFH